jgi:hypothetical protein
MSWFEKYTVIIFIGSLPCHESKVIKKPFPKVYENVASALLNQIKGGVTGCSLFGPNKYGK